MIPARLETHRMANTTRPPAAAAAAQLCSLYWRFHIPVFNKTYLSSYSKQCSASLHSWLLPELYQYKLISDFNPFNPNAVSWPSAENINSHWKKKQQEQISFHCSLDLISFFCFKTNCVIHLKSHWLSFKRLGNSVYTNILDTRNFDIPCRFARRESQSKKRQFRMMKTVWVLTFVTRPFKAHQHTRGGWPKVVSTSFVVGRLNTHCLKPVRGGEKLLVLGGNSLQAASCCNEKTKPPPVDAFVSPERKCLMHDKKKKTNPKTAWAVGRERHRLEISKS